MLNNVFLLPLTSETIEEMTPIEAVSLSRKHFSKTDITILIQHRREGMLFSRMNVSNHTDSKVSTKVEYINSHKDIIKIIAMAKLKFKTCTIVYTEGDPLLESLMDSAYHSGSDSLSDTLTRNLYKLAFDIKGHKVVVDKPGVDTVEMFIPNVGSIVLVNVGGNLYTNKKKGKETKKIRKVKTVHDVLTSLFKEKDLIFSKEMGMLRAKVNDNTYLEMELDSDRFIGMYKGREVKGLEELKILYGLNDGSSAQRRLHNFLNVLVHSIDELKECLPEELYYRLVTMNPLSHEQLNVITRDIKKMANVRYGEADTTKPDTVKGSPSISNEVKDIVELDGVNEESFKEALQKNAETQDDIGNLSKYILDNEISLKNVLADTSIKIVTQLYVREPRVASPREIQEAITSLQLVSEDTVNPTHPLDDILKYHKSVNNDVLEEFIGIVENRKLSLENIKKITTDQFYKKFIAKTVIGGYMGRTATKNIKEYVVVNNI